MGPVAPTSAGRERALPRDDELTLTRRLRESDEAAANSMRNEIIPLAGAAEEAGTRFPAAVARVIKRRGDGRPLNAAPATTEIRPHGNKVADPPRAARSFRVPRAAWTGPQAWPETIARAVAFR